MSKGWWVIEMSVQNPEALLQSLTKLPNETEWLEFKTNLDKPEAIGKYVSALSNSAILSAQQRAFLVFGVEDKTHKVVGTTVRLGDKTVGKNENFLHWLNKCLQPPIQIEHISFDVDGKHVELLCLQPPYNHPVRFNGRPWIRINSSLHPLTDHPAKEGLIWQAVSRFSFESQKVKSGLSEVDLENLFYLDNLVEGFVKGRSKGNKLGLLISEGFIEKNLEGGFDATNLLALTSAKSLKLWPGFERKGIRFISYKSNDKITSDLDIWGERGYFSAFQNAMVQIMRSIPNREELEQGVRKTIYNIPEVAVREILANAIVHQDLTDYTSGPMVEIFPDRVVITSPGKPLVEPDQFLNAQSRSRNTTFTDVMRRLGVCELRGSGIDRAFDEIETAGLPPISVRIVENSTVVTIFGPRRFADLSKEERIWACYWHACLLAERNEYMNNTSLRKRFRLNDKQYPQVSEVISDAIKLGRIRPLNEDQANRNAKYVPYWF